ncbi:FUSC family protein [Aeromicrobium terrae]|uniref:FUSC family protein n=1 Tax=Aeromicrobium terrae TaxID=2498846 RepID=UPI0022AB1515|nr:FUSC family protein [Aeromicrobium terrae]
MARLRAPEVSLADRWQILRRRWRLLLRLAIGPAVAYLVATDALDHRQAFFAPIAAIITLMAGGGARLRTVIELVIGVATGVLVGELLILAIGRGAWQIALVVVLAVAISTILGLTGIALTQAATSSVLLTAVLPPPGSGNPAVTRFSDALVGGLVGLLCVLAIPRHPVRDIDREVQGILTRLAAVLTLVASGLREDDSTQADRALASARGMQHMVDSMRSTTQNAAEVARMSPIRWRQRQHVELYASAVLDVDNAVRDARVLARKTSALLRHREAISPDMALAVDALAAAVEVFADDLSEQDDFEEARNELVQAARMASLALPEAVTMNSAAIAAQVRSLAADLLYASGYTRDEIDERLDF